MPNRCAREPTDGSGWSSVRSPVVIVLVGFIPSPRDGIVHIGPLPLHAYGLMLAFGVLAALKIAERRWSARGHDAAEIGSIALPVVVGGLVGARVYHLFTGYDWTKGGLLGTVEVWRGGLSIWGAVLGGLLVFGAVVVTERRFRLRKGQAFAMYVSLYTLGRTWFEALRIDKATRIFGIRFNLLLSAVICVGAAVWFIALGRGNDAGRDMQVGDGRRSSVES